jgi:dihydrofolate synthase/folylpolyglutamate synthase
MQAMLRALGDPQRSFRSILVGGTNGKGSVAAMAEALIRSGGSRTGLYTSPHLISPAERIRIAGEMIDSELFEWCAERVLPLAEESDATFFESLTATAFLAFARAGVKDAVVEVGLGGRLDATNLLEPDVCVITNVDLDHADWLGDTIEEIAAEKAGIIKATVPVVTGPLRPAVDSVIAARVIGEGSPRLAYGLDFGVANVTTGRTGTRFSYWSREHGVFDGIELELTLPGEHQATNAALALASVLRAGYSLRPGPSRAALFDLAWPGRFQLLEHSGVVVVLDVAHNPAGIQSLTRTLAGLALPRPLVGLIGILADKPWLEMLNSLSDSLDAVVLVVPPSAPSSRVWDPDEAVAAAGGRFLEVVADFRTAVSRSLELAGSGTVIVTGSNHTVGDALREFRVRMQRKETNAIQS